MQLAAAAIAGVDKPLLAQRFQHMFVDVAALALAVRLVRSDIVKTANVPVKTQPAHIVFKKLRVFTAAAQRIEIFDTQYVAAALEEKSYGLQKI